MVNVNAHIQLPTEATALAAESPLPGWPSLLVPETPVTEAKLCDWIAAATRGEAIEYHRGFLLIDRSEVGSTLPKKERVRLHAVARRAWIACELGLVHLFSVRLDEHVYRYIAVRGGDRVKPVPSQFGVYPASSIRYPSETH